jgi:hypothetical protein
MPLNVRIQGPGAHQKATVQLGVSKFSERKGKKKILNRTLAGTPKIAAALHFSVFLGFFR